MVIITTTCARIRARICTWISAGVGAGISGFSIFDNKPDGCECFSGEEIVHIGGGREEATGKSGGFHWVSIEIDLPRPITIGEDCGNQLSDLITGCGVVKDFHAIIPTNNEYAVGHVTCLSVSERKYRYSFFRARISAGISAGVGAGVVVRKKSYVGSIYLP